MTLLIGLFFGFLQGLRHAFEPDHVVAVSTMLSQRSTAGARVAYAASWGVGHAAMLVLVGGALMILRAELPPRLDAVFELAVSLMLITLGVRALAHAVGDVRQTRAEAAAHGQIRFHSHTHTHGNEPRKTGFRAIGPLAMGMVHGLAGSGALTALVVARLASPVVGIAFMVLFGIGATLGMALLAGVAGVPLARLVRTRWGVPCLLGVTGILSLGLGLSWCAPAAARVLSAT